MYIRSRCREVSSCMASWSRGSGLFGQIWCVLLLLFVAGVHHRGRSCEEKLHTEISVNKAVVSSYLVLLLWRGSGRSIQSSFHVLPGRKDGNKLCNLSSCKMRCRTFHCGTDALVFFLLSGLGGEGEGGAGFKAVGDRPWREELLESALLVAVPKRRRMAVAILGQRTGPATLGSWSCSSFFFLLPEDLPLPSSDLTSSCSPKWFRPRRE